MRILLTTLMLTCFGLYGLCGFNYLYAAMAKTPEQSDYTSIQERILYPEHTSLRAFAEQGDDDVGIPFGLKDYLELVDWGGREIKRNRYSLSRPSGFRFWF